MSQQASDVSLRLQDIAQSLKTILEDIAGEPIGFVLVVSVDKTTQYVSNCKRSDGTELLESLLARWKSNRADIPAHYNPDLRADAELVEVRGIWLPLADHVHIKAKARELAEKQQRRRDRQQRT